VDLVPLNDGDGFVHVMMRAINVRNHAVSQAARFGIIFFLLDIVVSVVQKLAGIMQTSDPGLVRINGRALFDILAVVECGALDFVNGMVNFFNGGVLFGMQSATVGPLQMRARIAQIGKRAQVGWMLALCVDVLRCEREQEGDRRSDHSNSSKSSHSDYHLVWDWDGIRRDGTAALPYNPVKHALAVFVVRPREAVSRKATRGAGLRRHGRRRQPLELTSRADGSSLWLAMLCGWVRSSCGAPSSPCARKLVVTMTAGTTRIIVTATHIRAAAHCWSARGDHAKTRDAERYDE
jgi:hypothetical protein